MKEQKILITGGTGKTGRRVVERLQSAGHHNIRVGSRNHEPAFDWENPRTWEQTVAGIDAVYITFQPDLGVPTAPPIIKAFTELASRRGVRKMVLLSGRGEKEAQACEEIVKATAAEWSILQASWFNQNFSEGFFLHPIVAGHFAVPRAEALEPFTDVDDIADVVVRCLLEQGHNRQTYELTGPRLLTFQQAVDEIAKATNRPIAFQALTIQEYEQMLREYELPEDYVSLVSYLFTEVLDGRNASVTNDIEKVLGRKAKDFSAYAADAAKKGMWTAPEASVKE
jgi:uncharacterized protein YbjT (DUF2867 family)